MHTSIHACIHTCRYARLQAFIHSFILSFVIEGSPAAVQLEELLLSEQVLKDVSTLSPKYQTSALEAKHSLDIQFVPKSRAFSYWGMFTRCAFHASFYS